MWLYNSKEVTINNLPEDALGFVYIITNLVNGRRYIGKKLLKFSKIKIVKGKKKKSKVLSDWLTYYSSSDSLKEDVKKYGKENFKREILHFCKSKAEMSYLELKEQVFNGVLESDMWYNSWIMVRIRKDHLKNLHLVLDTPLKKV